MFLCFPLGNWRHVVSDEQFLTSPFLPGRFHLFSHQLIFFEGALWAPLGLPAPGALASATPLSVGLHVREHDGWLSTQTDGQNCCINIQGLLIVFRNAHVFYINICGFISRDKSFTRSEYLTIPISVLKFNFPPLLVPR